MLKMAVLAPMPSASTETTASENAGARTSTRKLYRTSERSVRIMESPGIGTAGTDWDRVGGGAARQRSVCRQNQRRAAGGDVPARV
jgi:hypothetical protein